MLNDRIELLHHAATTLRDNAHTTGPVICGVQRLALADLFTAIAQTHNHYRDCMCNEVTNAVILANLIMADTMQTA